MVIFIIVFWMQENLFTDYGVMFFFWKIRSAEKLSRTTANFAIHNNKKIINDSNMIERNKTDIDNDYNKQGECEGADDPSDFSTPGRLRGGGVLSLVRFCFLGWRWGVEGVGNGCSRWSRAIDDDEWLLTVPTVLDIRQRKQRRYYTHFLKNNLLFFCIFYHFYVDMDIFWKFLLYFLKFSTWCRSVSNIYF